MIKSHFLIPFVIAVAGTVAITTVPAQAKKVGRYCQGDNHFHYGNGKGSNKTSARKAALRSWSDFTVFEYGGAYGSWRNARFKKVKCGRAGAQWTCDVSANPCRRAG